MQPYIFPYLGYYQLVNAAGKFVFYDDVNYIKQGFINRNSICNNGASVGFVLPVPGNSSYVKIKDLSFSNETRKILGNIKQSYSKAPFFSDVYPMVEAVFQHNERSVATICSLSVQLVFDYLSINKDFYLASQLDYNRTLNASDKIIDIVSSLNGSHYINSIGGATLYDKEYFASKGIVLNFIRMNDIQYNQLSKKFIPNLSIIDVLMNCDRSSVMALLAAYELV